MKSTAFIIITMYTLFLSTGCGAIVSEEVAFNAAETAGFTDVFVTNKTIVFVDLRGCGKDDDVRFSITAKNSADKIVEFYVCAGWLTKAPTIRYPSGKSR